MVIEVAVKPGSKKQAIEKIDATHWKIWVRERALEGRANVAVIEMVADELAISKSRVCLKSGLKSKRKILEILD